MSAFVVHGPFVFVTHSKAHKLSANLAAPADLVFTQRGSLGQVALVPGTPFDRYLVSQSQMKCLWNRADTTRPLFVTSLPARPANARSLPARFRPAYRTRTWASLGAIDFRRPRVAEQRAIAEALSDVDGLLGGLGRLIAKKRGLKQAALQQLLPGRTRLPGFSGAWEVKRLGDICEIAMGRTPPRRNQSYWGRGHVWLSIADLRSKVVAESKEELTGLAASSMTVVPKGTPLMSEPKHSARFVKLT